MTESEEVRQLRELLAQMPAISADADVVNLNNAVERLTLNDWANRTITAAERAGRPDIAKRVRDILQNLDEVDATAVAATQRRRDAEAAAREVLGGIDEA